MIDTTIDTPAHRLLKTIQGSKENGLNITLISGKGKSSHKKLNGLYFIITLWKLYLQNHQFVCSADLTSQNTVFLH